MITTFLPKNIKYTWLIAALIGFIDATYLTVSHLQGSDLSCSITGGCDQVLASSYSTIGPIPLAMLGALYYLVMLLGLVFVIDRDNSKILNLLAYLSIVGFLMSGYLFYVQWQIVQAFCQYCLLSALTSTILFILGLIILNKFKKYGQSQSL